MDLDALSASKSIRGLAWFFFEFVTCVWNTAVDCGNPCRIAFHGTEVLLSPGILVNVILPIPQIIIKTIVRLIADFFIV